MKKNKFVLFGLVFGFVFWVSSVSAGNLAALIEIPKILPSSPFYFLKNVERGVSRFFAFGNFNKAKQELNDLSDRALEIAALGEKNLSGEILNKALDEYAKRLAELKNRLFELNFEAGDSNSEVFLDLAIQNFMKQAIAFDTLNLETEVLRRKLTENQVRLDEAGFFTFQKFDQTVKFVQYLRKFMDDRPKNIYQTQSFINILSRWQRKFPESLNMKISAVKTDLIAQFEGELKALSPDALNNFFNGFKISQLGQVIAFESIREELADLDLKSRFNILRQDVSKEIAAKDLVSGVEAEEMIGLAESKLRIFENKINLVNLEVLAPAKILLEQAQINLEQAQMLYNDGAYNNAFSQAAVAWATALNGLNAVIVKTDIEDKVLRQKFDNLFDKARKLRLDQTPLIKELFGKAEKLIMSGKTIFDLQNAKIILGEIQARLNR